MEKCTKCGGLLNFDPSSQKLLCKSCQSTYDILESNKFVLHPFDMYSKTTEDPIDENSIKLTKKGLDLANQVWLEFIN